MEESILTMPAIALRGLCILPGTTVHFDISRKKSIEAAEKAMVTDQKVFLVAQEDPEVADPEEEDLFEYGVIAVMKQLVKLPGGMIRVMVEARTRAALLELKDNPAYLEAEVSPVEDEEDDLEEVIRMAMVRVLKEKLEEYGQEFPKLAREVIPSLLLVQDLDELMAKISRMLPWEYQQKQRILEALNTTYLYEVLVRLLITETEVARVKKDFQNKVKANIDKNQKDYILREQLKVIREELGEGDPVSEAEELTQKLDSLKLDKEAREKIRREISRFQGMPGGSQEAYVLRSWLDVVLDLPWKKVSKDNTDLKHAQEILDADHYGLEKVKERVLEFLAVRTLAKKGNGPILCLVGPPGTGKTSVAQSIARALGKKYVRISLGGVRDEAEIRGHRKTYIGAMPGRLVEALHQAGVSNPLMLLDEIDKVSSDYKGDTSSALLEVLDGAQNHKFRDHYVEIPVDLSQVLFIATANSTATIPAPLLDRMEIIEVNSYTENEKFHIAKEHLIPRQLEAHGLTADNLTISDGALKKMIHNYTREAGVRNLERRIGDVCRKTARSYLTDKKTGIRVTEGNLSRYLGKEKVRFEDARKEDQIGIVRGLAWTSVGGDTLEIEVNTMPGKGELKMTGQMGDVMKESAQIALTYVRSIAAVYGVPDEYFEKHDLHLHIPEGAVPKDGPSAGITMTTAMLSAVAGRKVSCTVAMTGEVDLRGRVMPIGGLKEKLLAAKMAHMKKVLVPDENRPDVAELSAEITRGMEIVFVKTMKEVLEQALAGETGEEGRSL